MRKTHHRVLAILAGAALWAAAAGARADPMLWPMYFGDARGTCSSPMIGVRGSPKVDWQIDLGPTRGYAIGADDCLYFATDSQQYFLRSVRPDGVLQWSVPGSRDMSPAFGSDGTMYSYRGGRIGAYAAGTLGHLWSNSGGSDGREVVLAADGTILSLCDQWGLRAFEPNGTRRWWSDNGGYGVCVVSDQGRVYCTDQYIRDRLYSLDLASGQVLWTRTMPLSVSRLMVATDGTVLMTGQLTGANGVGVRAIDADGNERWMRTYSDAYATRGAALRADDVLCFALRGGSGAGVYALAPDGTPMWYTPLADMADRYLTVDAEGKVYGGLADSNQRLFCLAADGDLQWILSPPTGNAAYSCPVSIGRDGTLFVVGSSRILGVGSLVQPVSPEPATCLLLAMAPAGVWLARRRAVARTGRLKGSRG